MNFKQQYLHPKWQEKRLEVLQHHNFTCQECSATEDTLHVHHTLYIKGRMIWEYELSELKCLCEVCHSEEHTLDDEVKKACANSNRESKQEVLGFLSTKAAMEEQKEIDSHDDPSLNDAYVEAHTFAEVKGISYLFPNLTPKDVWELLMIDGNCPPQFILIPELHNLNISKQPKYRIGRTHASR